MPRAFSILFFSVCLLAPLSALPDIEARLTLENDTLIEKRKDSDYTHGTALSILETHSGYLYRIQQTMYAPDDLSKRHHEKGDRPYCGMALFGIGHELFPSSDNWLVPDHNSRESRWTNYAELDFGMIGPAAGCKQTQKLVHKWLGCKDPKGWDDQLHNEFVVNVQYIKKYNYYFNRHIAIVPRTILDVGTVQDFGELGIDLKVGYNIQPTPASPIIFSAGKEAGAHKLSYYAFAGISERYYLYNHILEGSFFSQKDKDLSVDIEPFVSEFRFGAVVQYSRFYVSYIGVLRTHEFKHQQHAPAFGSICIGWTF